ncbi:4-hydroxy-tetrahydrodipicolinate synthase [Paraburkholderia youngii]|uniref:4-hydroxy-tetrahydrodipicolinate synthase n=1 Tax=Paraburkholderia youngii TaxID=2782701 RepID=A0A7Y6K1I2_9BURK|nr:4-hydroxy-tetrahydrodipicolinate synthase [Paraburkholderia youngii]NUY02707.1 4-hydroxy-tetrahydrodipicolinate synthase [Paraburkholderia youngii]
MYSGVWLPIVTPFRRGRVDIDALQYLADMYLRTEISGFVALGTTGEAALLSQTERASVLDALFGVVGKKLPVLVGAGAPDTREVLREIDTYDRWDCAGYLVSAPSYVCPDQTGVRWHFDQIARATSRPIVLYNVPHRTGVTIAPDTVAALLEHDNVVAIKECVASHFSELSSLSVSLLCGNDEAFVDCLSMGGAGGVLASAHVFADVLTEVLALMNADRETDARALFAHVSPITRLLFSAPNPAAIKAMIALDHPICAETRMPIAPASAELVARLRDAREKVQALRADCQGANI